MNNKKRSFFWAGIRRLPKLALTRHVAIYVIRWKSVQGVPALPLLNVGYEFYLEVNMISRKISDDGNRKPRNYRGYGIINFPVQSCLRSVPTTTVAVFFLNRDHFSTLNIYRIVRVWHWTQICRSCGSCSFVMKELKLNKNTIRRVVIPVLLERVFEQISRKCFYREHTTVVKFCIKAWYRINVQFFNDFIKIAYAKPFK